MSLAFESNRCAPRSFEPRKEGIAKNKTSCSPPLHTSLPSLSQHVFQVVLCFSDVLFSPPHAFRRSLQVRDTFCVFETKRLMSIFNHDPTNSKYVPEYLGQKAASRISALFMAAMVSFQVRFDLLHSPSSSSVENAAMSSTRRPLSHPAEC